MDDSSIAAVSVTIILLTPNTFYNEQWRVNKKNKNGSDLHSVLSSKVILMLMAMSGLELKNIYIFYEMLKNELRTNIISTHQDPTPPQFTNNGTNEFSFVF